MRKFVVLLTLLSCLYACAHSQKSTPALLRILKEGSVQDRMAAASVLGNRSDFETETLSRVAKNDPNIQVRLSAVVALPGQGEKARLTLRHLQDDQNSCIRRAAQCGLRILDQRDSAADRLFCGKELDAVCGKLE